MKRRQLVYVPKIEPNTFLFFYFEGETGRSYSFRDYTVTSNPPKLTYAEAYPYTADEILSMAIWHFDAETISTKDVRYWREQIERMNRKHLSKTSGVEGRHTEVADSRRGANHPTEQHLARQVTTKTGKPGSVLSISDSSGHQIGSVDDWLRFAPPKRGDLHWKDGRSAKELAKAFFVGDAPTVPTELFDLLASSDQLGVVQLRRACPEYKIRLDSYCGETRNADLVALGTGKPGVVPSILRQKPTSRLGQPLRKRSALPPHNQMFRIASRRYPKASSDISPLMLAIFDTSCFMESLRP